MTDSSSGAAGQPESDAWLGQLLDQFVDAIAEGRSPDLAAARAAHPELAAEIDETARVAEAIAPCRPARAPTVAGYALVRELGRGGMGTVYLAEHAELGRRVALKLLPARFAADGRARARFLREARAVARLDHERIVRVFDVGEDDGTPWFTMELVDGETLAAAIDRLRASGRPPAELDALDLARAAGVAEGFERSYARSLAAIGRDLAEALQHAHAAGVVHRDLKPSNAIVRRDGRAQLFDFGLASVDAEQSLTLSGHFLGTPHYASPEQASGSGELDPRSDVYSLGVTLYELATLVCPFRAPTTAEVLRRVQHEEAPRARSLNASLPRDLETILATAMAKEPARRYASAAAMAADLEALLDGRPVAARPVGRLARFARRVRRNPLPAALVAALIALPTLLYAQQRAANVEVRGARDAAEDALTEAQEHNRFLAGMLSAPDPNQQGREVRVADVLAQAEAELETRFADHPRVRLSLLTTIAETYGGLRLAPEALRANARRLELARSLFGGADPASLDAARDLAWAMHVLGRTEEALATIDAALQVAQLAPDDPSVMRSELARCVFLGPLGRSAEALAGLDALLVRLEPKRAENVATWYEALHNRALVLSWLKRPEEAADAAHRVYEERRAEFGAEAVPTIDSAGLYAQLLKEAGRREDGLALLESVLDSSERVFGEESPMLVPHLHNLAGCWLDAGDLELAESLQRRALELAERPTQGSGWVVGECRRQLARILEARGELDEAEAVLRAGLEIAPPDSGLATRDELRRDLGALLRRRGLVEEAAALESAVLPPR